MSLGARLALWFAAVAVAAVAIASGSGYLATSGELHQEVERFLVRRSDELVQGSRERPRNGGPDPDRPVVAVEADAIVQVLDDRGSAASSTGDRLPVDDTDARIATGGGAPTERDVVVAGVRYRMRTTALLRDGGGAVQVARSLEETDDVLAGLRNRLALVGALVAAAAAAIGWLVARRTTDPLRRLAATAEQVATTGDLATPVDTEQPGEVGQLARRLDAMLGALATSREQQRRLVEDAGHELRTPLTALRTDVDLLRRAPDYDPAKRDALVANIESEVVELADLVSELVGLATDTHGDEAAVDLDLADVVTDAVERFRRRTGRTVELDASASPVVGQTGQLDRAVTNLLGNAHKFSPPEAPIEVVVADGAVVVRDRGPGIPVEERPRVFDRFYRSAEARGAPGSGLGLAIVAQVVERHRGRTWVGEAPGGGAEVGFSLPLAS
jgi:two-component system sensor histidine kinase MprB